MGVILGCVNYHDRFNESTQLGVGYQNNYGHPAIVNFLEERGMLLAFRVCESATGNAAVFLLWDRSTEDADHFHYE